MSVLMIICLLMAGAFVGFIIAGLLSVAARDSEREKNKWWEE